MSKLFAAKYISLCSLHDTLSILGVIFWANAEADRFGILNDKSPYNFVVDKTIPLPNLSPTKEYKMRTIVLNRAYEILTKARKNKKKIAILWSGGVDSTCALAALLLVGAKKEEIIVLCTNDSINEYQRGYMTLKNEYNLDFNVYEWTNSLKIYDMFGTDVYFVTGWCADQLFGSNVNLIYPKLYRHFWKDGLKHIITNHIVNKMGVKLEEKEINNAIEEFEMYSKRLGLPLKYTCEALWMMNFCIKWSHVSRDFAMTILSDAQRENIINFYESIDFQEWSISNYKEFHKHNQALDFKNYKRPFKEIIYELFKDKFYLDNKGKVNSWISIRKGLQYSFMTIWDADGKFITHDILNSDRNYDTKDPMMIQKLNKRKYSLPYLKDWVDKEKFLAAEVW
jgi:hypothetical protein